MLRVERLNAFYGQAHVLFDVTLAVERGEFVALLGRNGAGKSTTLRSVMGLVERVQGRITHAGRDITGLAPHRIARLGLGYTPEERRVFAGLTVAENLEAGRRPPRAGLEPWTPERIYALFPQLEALAHRPAGRLSGGEQQMLTIARTLMGNPATILLDEPSEGLAPQAVRHLAETVASLQAEGLTLLLAEQNFRLARRLCHRAYIMEKGRIRYEGPMADLAADEATRRAYLMV